MLTVTESSKVLLGILAGIFESGIFYRLDDLPDAQPGLSLH